jgi:uncharacterized protein YwqG
MVKRATIEFVEASAPIRDLVTKFGGQPAWFSSLQWPVSRQTGQPMRFMAQIALDPDLFGSVEGRMAYLFMTEGDDYVDGTWEPDGGENAVIVQLGDCIVPTQNLAEGPTLYRMVSRPGHDRLVPELCEFSVRLTQSEDPEFVSDQDRWQHDQETNRTYSEALDGNKIAGTPGFLQSDEFPGDDFRKLLLQIDSTRVPFYVNFGDCGIGYAFLSHDGRSGKFLWQCS